MEEVRTFTSSEHAIHHADALELLQSGVVANESVSLIFADPPYNIGKNFNGLRDKWPSEDEYLVWFETWLDLCLLKLKPNGSLYVMCATQSFAPVDLMLRRKLTVLSRIVWNYDSSGVQAKRHFGSLWEPIFHCVKNPDDYIFNAKDILVEAKTGGQRKLIDYRKKVPTPYQTQKVPGNVWQMPRVRYRMDEYEDHPTQKPLQLLRLIVRASSNIGDTVLDPFGGTFTTAAAAQIEGRHSISIEINEDYLKIGLRRLGISQNYNGEPLKRLQKSYSKPLGKAQELTLFE